MFWYIAGYQFARDISETILNPAIYIADSAAE